MFRYVSFKNTKETETKRCKQNIRLIMSIDLMPLFVGRLIGYTKTEVKLGENYNDWKLETKRYRT